jgi:hypothetical protein
MQRTPLRKVGPVDALGFQRVGLFGVGSEVARIVGDLLEAGERPLLTVDRSAIVVVRVGFEALEGGFVGEHNHQGNQPGHQTGRRGVSRLGSDTQPPYRQSETSPKQALDLMRRAAPQTCDDFRATACCQ